jgi:hypothetical protein
VSSNARIISEAKQTQWRVANYTILLIAAAVGATRMLPIDKMPLWSKHLASLSVFAILGLILLVSVGMLRKTMEDLSFYRAHSKLNEELLNLATGLQCHSNAVVSARHPDMAAKHDFSISAKQNQSVFERWIQGVVIGASITAMIVTQVLIWV